MMTDFNKKQFVQMEHLKENCAGSISSSKESDAENVDAIKKYIEEQEQEILLGNSCHNLEPEIVNQIQGDSIKTANELLKKQLDPDDSDITTQSIGGESTSDIEECEISKKKIAIMEADTPVIQGCQAPVYDDTNMQEQDQLPHQMQINIQLQDVELAKDDIDQLQNNTNTTLGNQKVFDLNHDETKCNTLNETENTQLDYVMINKSSTPTINSLESSNRSKLESPLVIDCETKPALLSSEVAERPKLLHQLLTSDTLSREKQNLDKLKCENVNLDKEHAEETLAIATSVMDMILTDTEATISKKKVGGVLAKQCAEQG